jgi:hypothetical protein
MSGSRRKFFYPFFPSERSVRKKNMNTEEVIGTQMHAIEANRGG